MASEFIKVESPLLLKLMPQTVCSPSEH